MSLAQKVKQLMGEARSKDLHPVLQPEALLWANDVPGQHVASYYHATAHSLPEQPQLTEKNHADVAIIGAGFTGLSAAVYLAERGRSVVLLDANRVGWGASGRNGGQLATAQREDQQTIESEVGMKQAQCLWRLGRAANQSVKDLIAAHGIDCDLKPGLFYTDHKARFTRESKAYVEHMQKHYAYDGLRFLDCKETGELLGTEAYFSGVWHGDGGHLHPLNFALGLGRAALTAGVKIYEQSPVLSVTKECTSAGDKAPKSSRHRLILEQGELLADQVILATNGYLGPVEGAGPTKVRQHIMPINNFIVATEPLREETAHDVIRGDFAVADSKFVVSYFRKTADKRLLFGGGETYGYAFPKDIGKMVRPYLEAIYPQLKGVGFDYSWGGTLGITLSRFPYLRHLEAGLWTAGGYSGSGVGMATFSGRLLGAALMGERDNFDLMASVPATPFPGGQRFAKPLLAMAMTYYALRDRL